METTLIDTRMALHAIAEQLLAGDLHRSTGRIGLRVTPRGFGQPEHVVNGVRRRLRVDGVSLVVLEGDVESWHPITSLSGAGEAARTEIGPPHGAYSPETSVDPHAALVLDVGHAVTLENFYATALTALEQFRRARAAITPSIVQLWPEHFDLACSMAEVNFGFSPGDHDHNDPYYYVGPWSPRRGSYWNESWGVSSLAANLPDVDAIIEFFSRGLIEARGS